MFGSLPASRSTQARLLLVLALCTVVASALLLPWTPEVAQAKRYGYKKYDYGAIIAKCQGYCQKAAGAMSGCRNRAARTLRTRCVQASQAARASCAGDSTCKQAAKDTLRACVGDANGKVRADRKAASVGRCGGCCRKTRGDSDCRSYLSGSRFYGSYRYKGKLSCSKQELSALSPDMLGDTIDRLRGHAVAWLRDLVGRLRT